MALCYINRRMWKSRKQIASSLSLRDAVLVEIFRPSIFPASLYCYMFSSTIDLGVGLFSSITDLGHTRQGDIEQMSAVGQAPSTTLHILPYHRGWSMCLQFPTSDELLHGIAYPTVAQMISEQLL